MLIFKSFLTLKYLKTRVSRERFFYYSNLPAMTFFHISDTIQRSNDSFRHDTTVDRLSLWYEILWDTLGVNAPQKKEGPTFIGSTFGNSYETAAQAIAILEQKRFQDSQVIMINNASRAKHENSTQAKGSDCLWAQVEIGGVVHHIVGVDDDAFTLLVPYLRIGTRIQKITGLHYEDKEKGIDFQVNDLSKGTQFRSKEHFPLVQLLFQKLLQENEGTLPANAVLDTIFTFEYFNPIFWSDLKKQIVSLLWQEHSHKPIHEVVKQYVAQVWKNIWKIIREWGTSPTYYKSYKEGFEGIEKIQLLWELQLLREKFWVYTAHDERDFGISQEILLKYSTTRRNLKPNQLVLIDRDRFGNGIFSYGLGINGIHSFAHKNGLAFTHGTNKGVQKKLRLTWGWVQFEASVTETISDLTGENCIWESSSRGPSGEKLLNINTSINGEYKILEEIQSLPIGTVLTVSQ